MQKNFNIRSVLTNMVFEYKNTSGNIKDGLNGVTFKVDGFTKILSDIPFENLNNLVENWDVQKIASSVKLKHLIMLFDLPEEFALAEIESIGGEKIEFTEEFLNFNDDQTKHWILNDIAMLTTSLLFTSEDRFTKKIKKKELENYAVRIAKHSAKYIFGDRHDAIISKLRPMFETGFLHETDDFLRQLKKADLAWVQKENLGNKLIEVDDRTAEKQKKEVKLPWILDQAKNKEFALQSLEHALFLTRNQKKAALLAHNLEITSASPESIRVQYLTSRKTSKPKNDAPFYGNSGQLSESLNKRAEKIGQSFASEARAKPHWKLLENKGKKQV